MNVNAKQLAKLALIFFGLLFLVCICLGRRQKQPLSEIEGEKITVEDVEILLDAMGISISFSEVDDTEQIRDLQEKESLESKGRNEYLTYGQYGEICHQVGKEEWGLPDYSDKYEPEQEFLKEDWYRAFRMFLAYLDKESSIWETTVFVLKTDREKAEAYTENGAMQGACPYISTAFEGSELQELKVYMKGNTLLTIVEVLDRKSTRLNSSHR